MTYIENANFGGYNSATLKHTEKAVTYLEMAEKEIAAVRDIMGGLPFDEAYQNVQE